MTFKLWWCLTADPASPVYSSSSLPPAVHFSPSVMIQLHTAVLPTSHIILPPSGNPSSLGAPQDTAQRPQPGSL